MTDDAEFINGTMEQVYLDWCNSVSTIYGKDARDNPLMMADMVMRQCPDCIEQGQEQAWGTLGLPYSTLFVPCRVHSWAVGQAYIAASRDAGLMRREIDDVGNPRRSWWRRLLSRWTDRRMYRRWRDYEPPTETE